MIGSGPGLKIHPRHVPVEEARRELMDFLIECGHCHILTQGECLALLAEELHTRIVSCVRAERKER